MKILIVSDTHRRDGNLTQVLDMVAASRSACSSAAEAQRREQDTQAEQAAQLRADAIMTEARRACDGLRRQAEERLADAAALNVRRVVGDSCLLSK